MIRRVVQIQHLERVIVPVEDTGEADDSVDVDTVVGDIEFFQGFFLVFFAREQQGFGDALSYGNCTIIPLVAILLFSKFRYFRFSRFWRASPSFSALTSPRLFPCRFRLTRAGHDSRHFENIYIPISVSSL